MCLINYSYVVIIKPSHACRCVTLVFISVTYHANVLYCINYIIYQPFCTASGHALFMVHFLYTASL